MRLVRIGPFGAEKPAVLLNDDTYVDVSDLVHEPDWEVEPGIVIGRRTSHLDSVAQANDAISGFVLVDDVSERACRLEPNGRWSTGKSAETFDPAGPWLVELGIDGLGVQRQRVLASR